MLLQRPQQARGRLAMRFGGGRAGQGNRFLRTGPEAALRQQALAQQGNRALAQQALAQDVPGWAEEGMPVLGRRQSLLQEGGNGGIWIGPASEEMGVERFEQGGNGGIRSGSGSEDEMGAGERWPMRFFREGAGENPGMREVGGYPTFPKGEGIPGGEVPLEDEGGLEGWRMNRRVEEGVSDRGGVQMAGTGWEQDDGNGGMENGVQLPNLGDYGNGNGENYQNYYQSDIIRL